MNSEQLAGWSTNRHIRIQVLNRVDDVVHTSWRYEHMRQGVSSRVWFRGNQARDAIWHFSYQDVRASPVAGSGPGLAVVTEE